MSADVRPRPSRPPSPLVALIGLVGALGLSGLSGVAQVAAAADTGYPIESVEVSIHNRAALQRGAKYFVNYCLSCHSSRYARYRWVGEDLGLSEDMVKENLILTDGKVGDLMTVAIPHAKAIEWFGAPPPDLTLVARSRGADWLYTYLKSFYLDPERPMGVNNAIFQHVAMPHVLWELQGWQKPVYKEARGADDKRVIERLEVVEPGLLSPEEYDRVVRDLVTFLVYLAEPAALKRERFGIWVILFLLALLAITYFLKREYWKDVR